MPAQGLSGGRRHAGACPMVTPRKALVKPRVVSSETGNVLLLEDVVETALASAAAVVELVGQRGSGKSTSLAHLASLPCAERLHLIDDVRIADLQKAPRDRLVVYTTDVPVARAELRYELAPWSDDDLIEYLLATHPGRCASVMARFSADMDRGSLQGTPALCCLVAEQMARDERIQDVRTAVRRAIVQQAADQRAGEEQTLEDARFHALARTLNNNPDLVQGRAHRMAKLGVGRSFMQLLKHPFVQLLLAADRVVVTLKRPRMPFPTLRFPHNLVLEIARLVQEDRAAQAALRELAAGGTKAALPMVASILHAAIPPWRPDPHCSYLQDAYLPDAQWQSISLAQANLRETDLRRSDLQDADLKGACLFKANLSSVRADNACLAKAQARGANFAKANLRRAQLSAGEFLQAKFAGAVLDDAVAHDADFQEADLRGASLRRGKLDGSRFGEAKLSDADFRDANLQDAILSDLDLRDVLLEGANLKGANLSRCNLEFVALPQARLSGANLSGAYLTGSQMPVADFRHAKLYGAGLADVDWEGADLRSADLRKCSFHLGSSRSGLVGSPYPGHGSRTGFYTDDFDDQSYKSPELIRKANLCGADLRGAQIEGVDFYLVDLRGARYDPEQEEHLRRCDAILNGQPT